MNKAEFEEITGLIERGGDVSADELMDLLAYSGSAIYELRQTVQRLVSGYAALQKAMARKDNKLEISNRMLTAVRAENMRLRETVRELRGDKDPSTGLSRSPSPIACGDRGGLGAETRKEGAG